MTLAYGAEREWRSYVVNVLQVQEHNHHFIARVQSSYQLHDQLQSAMVGLNNALILHQSSPLEKSFEGYSNPKWATPLLLRKNEYK